MDLAIRMRITYNIKHIYASRLILGNWFLIPHIFYKKPVYKKLEAAAP